MKKGIELIAEERQNQISKGYTTEIDIRVNNDKQLLDAAVLLMSYTEHLNYLDYNFHECVPDGWNLDIWVRLCRKPYLERITIAGALIAAEIDRINSRNKEQKI